VGKAGKKNTPKNILRAKPKAAESPTPEQEAEPVEIGHEYTLEQLPDGLYRIVGDRPIKLTGGSTLDTSVTPQSPTASKLSRKKWIAAAYAWRPNELLAMGITAASIDLVKESRNAADCANPFDEDKPRYAEKLLRDLGVFPKARRGSPKRRRKK
jgi:hypothetical protein